LPAPPEIHDLVERFHANLDAYRSGGYDETAVRVEFIDPFFKALGWDVHNAGGYAEAYKDVIHEDRIRVGGASKAPDYSFRVGGTRKFFVEAKKPSVDIKHDVHPAYQLRRYAWSAKLPLSILTDFEEFAVYDCRVKPAQNDAASKARTAYYKYTDYIDKWDEIAEIFARDAVLKGSFDRYAESNKRKKGTAEVDAAFLEEIEHWREILARNIALRNKGIPQRDLNHAVQATIDRIVFLRIAEDRGLEKYGQLQELLSGSGVYEELAQLFQRADDRYNSGLFHFKKEKGREEPDTWTLQLKIDDKVLKEVVKGLYYPFSPYEFGVLPADILGQVYERFLGKVIRLKGRSAVVEEKPEVRKAGGVYYTPTYIVDYIVRHTVGKLVEGKTPNQVRGKGKGKAPIRVVDPACGSGSFLLGAYQFLLDWYLEQYKEEPAKHLKGKEPAIFETSAKPAPGETDPGTEYRLTTAERKRILTDHIYGVDIDTQAVEVTKLSLLLKVLEGENIETLNKNMKLFHERALPDLARNIQCGNSLIGSDFYSGMQIEFDEEDIYRINAFDWDKAFPEVFKGDNPGFDAVIGNPPYIRIQTMKETAPEAVDHYKSYYATAVKGNYDIYVLFVEKGLKLLNESGRLGIILPHKFFNAKYGESLRMLIAEGKHLEHVVHFSDEQVFVGATTYTCLLFLTRTGNEIVYAIRVDDLAMWRNSGKGVAMEIPVRAFSNHSWNISTGGGAELLYKLLNFSNTLENVTERIFQGLKTSADKVYIVEKISSASNRIVIYSKETEKEHQLEPDLLHPLIKGGDSKRYQMRSTNRLILFPYAPKPDGKSALIEEQAFLRKFPLTWSYLCENRGILESRERGRMKGSKWYGYIYPKALDVMPCPKIFTPDIAATASFSLDTTGENFFTGGVSGGYGILTKRVYSQEYILGLLNSKLASWFIRQTATQMRGGYYSFEARFIRHIPIVLPNPSIPSERRIHDAVESQVKRMLDMMPRLNAVRSQHDQTALQRQIKATDAEIDRLVYELYGLTDDEIRIVEGSADTGGKWHEGK